MVDKGKTLENKQECICGKEMFLVDTIEVLGLDNKISKIEIWICWDCKKYRKNYL